MDQEISFLEQRILRTGGAVKTTAIILFLILFCDIEFKKINIVVGGDVDNVIIFNVLITIGLFIYMLVAYIKYVDVRSVLVKNKKFREEVIKIFKEFVEGNKSLNYLKEEPEVFAEIKNSLFDNKNTPELPEIILYESHWYYTYIVREETKAIITEIKGKCMKFRFYLYLFKKTIFYDFYLPKFAFWLGFVFALSLVVRLYLSYNCIKLYF